MADAPTNIRALQAEQTLELTWPSGRVDRLRYRSVRGHCPCAVCVDENTGRRVYDESKVPEDIRLEGMDPIGNYAVRLSWNDGHSSGLYTWDSFELMAPAEGP
jgi:DUF971 family protein